MGKEIVMIRKSLAAAALGCVLGLSAGIAANQDEGRQLHSDKAREKLAGFEYTGNSELCLRPHMIRNVNVLDDWTLLVEMTGRRYYVNHLPYRCPSLSFEERFSYTLRGLNMLCNTDTITVLFIDMRPGASCGLGKFEELKKKPAP